MQDLISKHNVLAKIIEESEKKLHAMNDDMIENFGALSTEQLVEFYNQLEDSPVKFNVFLAVRGKSKQADELE